MSKSAPKISVILPCYNAEAFIGEAIRSILDQTFTDFELIVIDDGSKDSSANIIHSFNDKRINYVKNETNLGLIKTLNRGLSIARGEYIARMDADDISFADRFEKQVQYLDAHPEIGLLGSGYVCFPVTRTVIPIEKPTLFDVMRSNPFAHPTIMFRREMFHDYGLYYDVNYPHAEDYELWSRAIRYLGCHNLQEPLLKYRVHPDSITKTQSKQMSDTAEKIRQSLLDFCTNNSDEQKLLKAILDRRKVLVKISIAKLAWYFLLSKFSSGQKAEQYHSKYNRLKSLL